ncbi:sugar transferase [Pajaroellobacter abortibovis]|uniref:sugar transferase n=1 Tax=Pajaroellobacter abortibovis TaxID=1882918 RepID=UPI00094B5689|nr:sugar transferase [Pajaroellobacter abortibovis]
MKISQSLSPSHKQRGWRLTIKQCGDRIIAGTLLAFTAPLFGIIGAAIYARMGPPIFFRQTRPGLHGRPFALLKFRTMNAHCDERGLLLDDAHRITPLGHFLRSTSLDELPQLLNVLKGELSLVGPRPLLMEYLQLYSPEEARRHDVLPGITGWSQVNGRNALTWEEKLKLDVWYVDHWSLALDVIILAKTFVSVLKRQGIFFPGQATMPKFSRETALPSLFPSLPHSQGHHPWPKEANTQE